MLEFRRGRIALNVMRKKIIQAKERLQTRVHQWLSFKHYELLMMDWMSNAAGKEISSFHRKQLRRRLSEKNRLVVLTITHLVELTNSILEDMKKYVKYYFCRNT